MDDQTTNMWMSTWKNKNINIILINSLELLHQRGFSLQSFQQRVILASNCNERPTNIKDEMRWDERKWKRNRVKRIDQSFRNGFPSTMTFLLPTPLLLGFLRCRVFVLNVSFLLNTPPIDWSIRTFLCA